MDQWIRRFAPLAGVVFVVLVLVGFAIEGDTPAQDDPATDIVQFYVDNDVQVIVASALVVVGGAFLVLFAARLGGEIRERAADSLLAVTAIAGGAVAAAGMGVDSALRFALASSAEDISPDAFTALFATWNMFFWPMHLGLALMVISASLHAIGSGMLPKWLAGLGILVPVLMMIPVLPVLLTGIAAAALWVFITSVLLFRRQLTASA